jgi:hypothetical protein
MVKAILAPNMVLALQLTCVLNAYAANMVPAARPTTDILVRMSSPKAQYHVGEPVMIKIELVNVSQTPLNFMNVAPWNAVDLHVMQFGAEVKPVRPGIGWDWKMPNTQLLAPGQSYALHWQNDTNPLSFWGFANLPAGHYVIFATPTRVAGYTRERGFYYLDHSTRSNAIEINIVQ